MSSRACSLFAALAVATWSLPAVGGTPSPEPPAPKNPSCKDACLQDGEPWKKTAWWSPEETLGTLSATCGVINNTPAGEVPEGFSGPQDVLNKLTEFCKTPLSPDACTPNPVVLSMCMPPSDEAPLGGGVAAALGGGVEDRIIRGLAAFLESRAKAEVMASIVENLKDSLCSSALAKSLLPTTCALALASDPYVTPTSWGTFKAAFESDLLGLPRAAIEQVMPQGSAREAVATVFDVMTHLLYERLTGAKGTDALSLAKSIATTLSENVATRDLTECKFGGAKPIERAGCALVLVTRAFTVAQSVDQWRQENGPEAAELAWMWQVAARLTVDGLGAQVDATFGEDAWNRVLKAADTLTKVVKQFEGFFLELAQRLDEVVKLSQALRQATTDADRAEARRKLVDKIGLAVDSLASRGQRAVREAATLVAIVTRAKGDVLAAQEAVVADATRYLAALSSFGKAMSLAADRQYMRVFLQVFTGLQTFLGDAIPKWLARFGPFLAEVASAETSADVAQALENAAAPLGSYRAKRRKGRLSVGINAYVGLLGGFEFLTDVDVPAHQAGSMGLFAPVGVEVSWAFSEGYTFGAFISVIDVGSLLSFRLDSSSDASSATLEDKGPAGTSANTDVEVEQLPALTFAQVFAPGLFLVFGLSDAVPLTVGIGASVCPELRSANLLDKDADSAQVASIDTTAVRVGIFLAVDIPIFSF